MTNIPPWLLTLIGVTIGAALFAAGVAAGVATGGASLKLFG